MSKQGANNKTQEVIFQNDIIQALAEQGWQVGEDKHYDKAVLFILKT